MGNHGKDEDISQDSPQQGRPIPPDDKPKGDGKHEKK